MLPARGREEGLISLLCVLPVLLLLTCASIVHASPAHIGGDWMYEIRARDITTIPDTDFTFSNAGPIEGIGDISGGGPFLGPSVSFDITTNRVRVSAHLNGCEIDIPCSMSTAHFSIDDGTVALSGVGHGGARGEEGSAFFGLTSNLVEELNISIPSLPDTAFIFEARTQIAGGGSQLVSEPTDSAFLAVFVGLAAALFRWRKQLR